MNILAKIKTPIRIVRSFLGIQRKRISYEHERLFTEWGQKLQSGIDEGGIPSIRNEHPHPQFKRASYETLNGWWDFKTQAFDSTKEASLAWLDEPLPSEYGKRIIVPFSPETALSQIEQTVHPNELMWYRRAFSTPTLHADERMILHFEAVDWACSVYVNGTLAEVHVGAYLPFSVDITNLLDPEASEQEIAVCAYDPSEFGVQLRGKQRIEHIGMWYTAQSGIWQPVWLERVPETRILELQVDSFNLDGIIRCDVTCTTPTESGTMLSITVFDGNIEVAKAECLPVAVGEQTSVSVSLEINSPKTWSPDNPHLYTLQFEYGEDRVESYCGFRTTQVARDANGTPRFMLNGEPFFVEGVLDQGYWPESLMTAPSLDALAFDARAVRKLGFNTARKHVKVESDLWYAECDRLGVLVWQDVPSGGVGWNEWETTVKPSTFASHKADRDDTNTAHKKNSADSALYQEEWADTARSMTHYLKNHPSIVAWGLFNEGWGQFDSAKMTALVRSEDHTRPVDAASGWFDQGVGDFATVHDYSGHPDFSFLAADDGRAKALTEFGGLSLAIDGHVFNKHHFGYKKTTGLQSWASQVTCLIEQVKSRQCEGLAGYVYTQLTDVEEETNGLLTYDRVRKRGY